MREKYPDGQAIAIEDTVDLGDGISGVVVAIISQREYAIGYSEEEWGYLENGVLIMSRGRGLVHFPHAHVASSLVLRRMQDPATD